MDSRELRPQLGLFGEAPKERGEPWRQQRGVAARDQVGMLLAQLEGAFSSRLCRRLVVHFQE
ncbi:hypothetical protein ADL29_23985 [Streptomyces chattanoogensis]|uniref:Uncharacterized protein n=1 Tax=Streptomyces chattanoogensis TaxID=66876 RepID=A0A0N0GYG0_9ACTN|nr:hypothetical protein ADL29_23985 [Streptomyces chattanoogensis]